MTIDEITASRDVLRDEIARLVEAFEAVNGVLVASIGVARETDYEAGLGKPLVNVVVQL